MITCIFYLHPSVRKNLCLEYNHQQKGRHNKSIRKGIKIVILTVRGNKLLVLREFRGTIWGKCLSWSHHPCFLWQDHFTQKVLAGNASCTGFNLGNNPHEVAAFRLVVKRPQVITDCASLCVTAGWHLPLVPHAAHSLSSLSSSEILPGLGVSRAARSGEESREAWVPEPPRYRCVSPNKLLRVPGHSQEWLLGHCQQQELSEKMKKNQIGSLWPMELIQGLLCGKTHPPPQGRPGRQSGTDYSLCRDFIAGSIKMNF